ncbi:Late embryoproteinsis abundant protein family protein [Hibiscus syriacus]|uniref:Late embryoproteinsis abundant protein family protein n=1 Tax=Hibiscus syriacus TaxID=106335 RepID=A0A6A2YKR6_HIBSY|nr:ribosomal RNA-processing protein 7 homolog A-like [Hibiscus syriacus]KAE8679237.1 Late embryoproteinsis abundant protein family protein [Hibiscus syriacus]
MKNKTSKEKAKSVGIAEDFQMVENLVATKQGKKKDKLSKTKRKSKEKNASVGTDDKLVDDNEVYAQDKCRKDRKKKSNGQLLEKSIAAQEDGVYEIPSGDDDCSKGMKKWLTDYHQSRPGLKVLQQRIDEFIIAYEEKIEQERKEKEARLTEGGWILVEHHKGRKKTTDSESGTTVGSVSQAAVEEKLAKKKSKEVSDFYRFQKREAQRNELLTLQSKFEQDKKRIQQMRAARKFRPY